MTRLHMVLFVLLLGFWFALSEQHTPLFLGMAVTSAALTTWLTAPLVADVLGPVRRPASQLPGRAWYAVVYLGWLGWSILASAVQVAWIVVNPRVPPEPSMLRFRTSLESRLARVLLANTISLVPGTITVRLEGAELWVHALVPAAADDLLDGSMQMRIGRVFGESAGPALDPRWESPPEVPS